MAAKYRKIDPRFWKDEKVMSLSIEEKAIALYVLTAQSNRIGLFTFSPALAAEDLGCPPDALAKGFARACDALGWQFDRASRVLWIPRWWKYNPPESWKNLVGNLKDIEDLPKTRLLASFFANLADIPENLRHHFQNACPSDALSMPLACPSDALPKGMGKPLASQEQEQEQEGKSPPPPATGGEDQTADATVPPVSPPPPPPPPGKAKGPSKSKEPDFDPLIVDLPFKSDRFREAWIEWCDYRRARKPALTEHSVRKQLKDFIAWGEEAAIAAIGDAIRNGWQGLFPPKGGTVNPSGYKSKIERDNEVWIENAQSCLE